MVDYAIGDIQGCYDQLMQLLDEINFDETCDNLWFVGDLVNRGPQSLDVLRFIKSLPETTRITLGNHDLHLLGHIFTNSKWINEDDTIEEILTAPDMVELGHWLRQQSLIHYDAELNVVMAHAGISPLWDLNEALSYGQELETVLHGEHFKFFLEHMYGNEPDIWQPQLTGIERLRSLCNYFTRMRFCDASGALNFSYKGRLDKAPKTLYPWYEVPLRKSISADIVFGHWAALMNTSPAQGLYAIDSGCLWGGQLTALRLQDKKRFTVPGMPKSI